MLTQTEKWALIPERLTGIIAQIQSASLKAPTTVENPAEYSIDGGVAVINIRGVLAKRPGWLQMLFGSTAMQTIGEQVNQAKKDPKVKSILLNVDSPGGTVDGTNDLAEIVRAASEKKPVVTFVNGMAASAAYWIGSSADWIITPQTGEVGSIGVVQAHYDYSVANEKAGVKRSFIYAGKYKTIGNDSEPLSEDGKAYIQAGVDYVYSLFVDSVAQNRGLPVQSILDTEGRIYIGTQAIDSGLADQIGDLDQAIAKARYLADRFAKFGKQIPPKATAPTATQRTPAAVSGPKTFTEAWQSIKDREGCTTESAMKQAVRDYPALHKLFIFGQPGRA